MSDAMTRITDEAVEAACRGSWDHRHAADGGWTWDEAVQHESKTFEEGKILLQPYRVSMRKALEAALPYLPEPQITSREPQGSALEAMRKWYADMNLPGPDEALS